MIAGALLGYIVHEKSSPSFIISFSENIKLLTTIFLRLVQMIIAPLVFSTLVVGIAKLGDLKTVGRIGGKALLWFVSASLISLLIGLVLVNYFKPGAAINLEHSRFGRCKRFNDKYPPVFSGEFCGTCFSKKYF